MSKVSFNFPFAANYSKSLGNYSMYKMRGVDKIIFRSKGGASKEKILTAPEFEKVRMNNSEFGGCGKSSGKILHAMHGIKHLADYSVSGALTSIAKEIQKLDGINPIGQRSILLSEFRSVLSGFNLNRQHVYDSVIKHSPHVEFSRNELKASLHFPELYPKINLANPWQLEYYRFIIMFGIIPDMVYTSSGYQQANELVNYTPVEYISDWFATDIVLRERTIELQMDRLAFIDSSASLVVSIGVEFGRNVYGFLRPVKYSGSGKILALG